MSIFKDGYLKSEFINKNYRGLVGWECEAEFHYKELPLDTVLIAAVEARRKGFVSAFDNLGEISFKSLKIKQFTPADIPVGELCWMEDQYGGWILNRFQGVDTTNHGVVIEVYSMDSDSYFISCVPFLIAETSEDAEKLKNWSTNV